MIEVLNRSPEDLTYYFDDIWQFDATDQFPAGVAPVASTVIGPHFGANVASGRLGREALIVQFDVTPVPLPASLALMLPGMLVFIAKSRCRVARGHYRRGEG